MNPQVRVTTPLPKTPSAVNAVDVVDVVLRDLIVNCATVLWFEPHSNAVDGARHRLTMEKNRRTVMTGVLDDGLGDAVLARFALLARLDLLAKGVQNGRVKARVDAEELDLLVTIRPTQAGLSGELRVLNEAGSELEANVVAHPSGGQFPDILVSGSHVGSYRVECVLGHGGMGIVYRVQHTHLRKDFAMKVLLKNVLAEDVDAARRFVREARAAARVQHESIVDVSDFGSLSDGRHYLVMELLRGKSLDDTLNCQGSMSPLRALGLMREVASALAAAHSAGIVHRDVSPSNIFVDENEKVTVMDFGAASLSDTDQSDVPDGPPGMVVGTPYYIAPEQAQGLPTDSRSDMYSFGVVFYELVAGSVPFHGETAREIVMKHILDEPVPLWSPHGGSIPEELWLLIQKLMAKKPEDRYSSTGAVISEIDRIIALLQRKGWRRWLPS